MAERMHKILTLNNISPLGLARLPADKFKVAGDLQEPDGILLRSFKMHEMPIPWAAPALG